MPPNPYDQAARYLAKLDPAGFLRWLLAGLRAGFRLWLDTRTIPFPGEQDRVCDTVAGLVDDAEPDVWWAVPIEFQRRPDATLFGRLLEYLGRLWRELRPPGRPKGRFRVGAAVVNLAGRGRTSRDMALRDTGLRTCLQVVERNLAEEDAAATLAGIAAGQIGGCLLPLIPLMRGGAEAGIIDQWKNLALAEPDERRRGDYGGLALVFAERAGCWPLWHQALEGWNVEVSQQVLAWQAEAEKRGRSAGKVEGKAEAVLRLLERRFGVPVPQDLADVIRTTRDEALLDRLLDVSFAAVSLDDFRGLAGL